MCCDWGSGPEGNDVLVILLLVKLFKYKYLEATLDSLRGLAGLTYSSRGLTGSLADRPRGLDGSPRGLAGRPRGLVSSIKGLLGRNWGSGRGRTPSKPG